MSDAALSTSNEISIPPCIIFITGLSGIGKHTIARKIHRMLNPKVDKTIVVNREANSTLIRNHLIIDLVSAIAPWKENRARIVMRNELVSWTLDKLLKEPSETRQRTYILTSQIPIDTAMQRHIELLKYIEFAEALDVPFFWFEVVCSDRNEHLQRVQDKRRCGAKTKDPDKVLQQRENVDRVQMTPIAIEKHLKDYQAIASRYHVLDTAHKRPKDVAREILSMTLVDCGEARRDSSASSMKETTWSLVRSASLRHSAKVKSTFQRVDSVLRPGNRQ